MHTPSYFLFFFYLSVVVTNVFCIKKGPPFCANFVSQSGLGFLSFKHDSYIHIYVYIYTYICLYIWAIPPKVAPVSENTVFVLFPENTVFVLFPDIIKNKTISELIVVFSYLIFHSGLFEHCLSKNVWFIHNINILSTEIKHKREKVRKQ